MFVNSRIFLVTASFNIKFRSIMNIQGRGETESANSLKTTILAFTARQINIEMVVKNPTVRNIPHPHRSSKARNIQEYQPIFERKFYKTQFLSIFKQKQRELADGC